MYQKLQYVNEQGGVQAWLDDNHARYVAPTDAEYVDLMAIWEGRIDPMPPALPTAADVNAERQRRVEEGFVTPEGVHLSGRDTDQRNLQGLAFAAQLRTGQGTTGHITPFRDHSNAIHFLTDAEILRLWAVGAAFVSDMYQSAWVLKDNPDGIPEGFRQDEYWLRSAATMTGTALRRSMPTATFMSAGRG